MSPATVDRTYVVMYSALHFRQILMKAEFSQQFSQVSNIKYNNPFIGRRVDTRGQTDMTKLTSDFPD